MVTPQKQFLCNIDIWGIAKDYRGVEYCDIHMSYHNLDKVRELKNISPLRWVEGKDMKIAPGRGSGLLKIGNEVFTVVYAWGGRDIEGQGYEGRTSYTTRLEGERVGERMNAIIKQIIIDENGAESYTVNFREHHKVSGISSAKEYREKLVKTRNNIKELVKKPSQFDDDKTDAALRKILKVYTKRHIDIQVANFKKRWRANKNDIVLTYFMKNIETDML